MSSPRPRLLLVDDEPVFRTSLADHLKFKRPEIDVVTAPDGARALEILRDNVVDILVTDVRMPRMDGMELLAAVLNAEFDLDVVVMTAFGTSDLRSRALELGALTVLNKPLDIRELLEAVDTALGDDQGRIRGISVAGFLQLIQAERKSYSVEITSPMGAGTLIFDHGTLVDAHYGELRGEVAALKLAAWEHAEIRLDAPPSQFERRIDVSLTHLLLEAARLTDEAGEQAAGGEEAVRAADTADGVDDRKRVIRRAMERAEQMRSLAAAAVVENRSGEVLHSVGHVGSVTAASAALQWMPLVEAQLELLQRTGIEDEPEVLIMTTDHGRHFLRPIPGLGWLYLVVDREGSNLALAWREVDAIAVLLTPPPA